MTDPATDRPAPAGTDASRTGPPRELPGDRPPKRLLERAPSERLAARGGTAAGATPAGVESVGAPGARSTAGAERGSPGRAVLYGLAAAAAGTLAHLVAATLLLWTGALLVVAVTLGILVGIAVAVGAGSAMRARARRSLAIGLALGAVGVAVGVNWVLSGMYLGPLDYLVQVYGLLVPVQLALAAAGAVAGSR